MTTTGLIKILKDNEYGGISHKPRELSLTINGKYMPNPQITLSSTGDGICGAEIDLDVDGEFFEEQDPILSKIKEIVNEWKSDSWTDNLSYECMIKIAKLVEPQESI